MGGDDAPEVVVEGARIAVERYGRSVLLVGDPDKLGDTGNIEVVPASEVIPMGADPASSVRRMKDSSIVRAAEAVRDGRASALLSAGNTGAAMAASLLRLGRIKGVSRPAIAVPFPVVGSTPTLLLDCGANAECRPEWLLQFAKMGVAYSRCSYGVTKPRVGLLTIGEEAGKGNELVKATAELLETSDWAGRVDARYVGNVEGRDLMIGEADVIVADGFTGNIVLKSMEGLFSILNSVVRSTVSGVEGVDDTVPELTPTLHQVLDSFDPTLTGAALLLGVRGVSVISHGSSTAETIAHAIGTVEELVSMDIVTGLRQIMAPTK